jgi:hypothetical protein
MGSADNYRQQADEAAARVDWCEKKIVIRAQASQSPE